MIEKETLEAIRQAYEARDLQALEQFAKPVYRKLNKTKNYRSVLMLSCNNIKHLSKIETLEAECIMLNLEDGVAPSEKPFALVLCAIFLSHLQSCAKKLVVRVNSLETSGYDEIAYLNQFMPDAVRVPKIKTPKEVHNVYALLHDEVELHLSIETKEAWYNLKELKIAPRVEAFYLGILDIFADMGISQENITPDNPTLLYMLPHFFITCKTMGVKPVSFVYQEYKNQQRFLEWLALEKSIGFDAKGCISPKQVALVHKTFVLPSDEIKKAKEIVQLFEENIQKGISGFTHGIYGFIDEPIYKGAKAVLEKHSV